MDCVLKIVLERHAVDVFLPEAECKQIIDGWTKGSLKPIIGNANVNSAGPNGWAVQTAGIKALFMGFVPPQQQPMIPATQQLSQFNRSGI